ncbi:MAG: hypothetical protein ABSC22_10780, partial [Roseiarcus sp.]
MLMAGCLGALRKEGKAEERASLTQINVERAQRASDLLFREDAMGNLSDSVRWFDSIRLEDVPAVGGKNASL